MVSTKDSDNVWESDNKELVKCLHLFSKRLSYDSFQKYKTKFDNSNQMY